MNKLSKHNAVTLSVLNLPVLVLVAVLGFAAVAVTVSKVNPKNTQTVLAKTTENKEESFSIKIKKISLLILDDLYKIVSSISTPFTKL